MSFRVREVCLACVGVVLAGCRAPEPAALVVVSEQRALGGHVPPELSLQLRTAAGVKPVAQGAYFAALGPGERVAYLDGQGLKLWKDGTSVWISAAQPRGLGAAEAGAVFPSAAARGKGSGVALMSWDGAVRTLIPAPEELPGPAGYHAPALSPSGRYVVAFSDLTPRPSLYRVTLRTGAVEQLSADAPPIVGAPRWDGEVLRWSTGEGSAWLNVATGEVGIP